MNSNQNQTITARSKKMEACSRKQGSIRNYLTQRRGLSVLLACLVFSTAGCADSARFVRYEFWNCDETKDEIVVLTMPRTYRPTIPENVLISGKRRPDYSAIFQGGGVIPPDNREFNGTDFYATYPDFDPIGAATSEQIKRTEAALANLAVTSGSIDKGHSIDSVLYGASHELGVRPTRPGFRWREDSVDGKYWVYADPWLRNGGPGSDTMANFLPKNTGFDVLVRCADMRTNAFPPDHYRCGVYSRFIEVPSLSCITLQYRIRAGDIPRWRELDAKIKAKVQSMVSYRQP
jgi:hypothetical protein